MSGELKLINTAPPRVNPDSAFHFWISRDVKPSPGTEPCILLDSGDNLEFVTGHTTALEVSAIVYPHDTPRADIAALALRRAGTLSGVEKLIAIYKTTRFVNDGSLVIELPASSPPRMR